MMPSAIIKKDKKKLKGVDMPKSEFKDSAMKLEVEAEIPKTEKPKQGFEGTKSLKSDKALEIEVMLQSAKKKPAKSEKSADSYESGKGYYEVGKDEEGKFNTESNRYLKKLKSRKGM
jgi:hypothetical protein